MSLCYYNGRWGDGESISLPLSDRAIYFGDGVYDLAVGGEGGIYFIDEHISRLLHGAKEIGIEHGYTHLELYEIIMDAALRASKKSYTVYFQLTRSAEERHHSALGCKGANLLIKVDNAPRYESDLIKLITLPDLRYSYCYIKTLNLLPAVIASTEAEKQGADEAVLYKDGYVTECAHSNVSIIYNGRIITRPTDGKILPGITRSRMLKAASRLGIMTEERRFTLGELYSADEIIVTSTTRVISRAKAIDGVTVGGRAQDIYSAIKGYMQSDKTNR